MKTSSFYPAFRFSLLIGAVFISGVAEGMLLPLISILLEQNGTPASLNGVNAAALYLGVLAVSPFIEKPIHRFGYKPILLAGLFLIMVPIFLFPLSESLLFWFVLRLLIGCGDNMLHFAAQTWITVAGPENKKGRNIAIYGLSFGLGFAAGPLLSRLLVFGLFIPFVTAGCGCLVIWLFIWLLENDRPETFTSIKNRETANWKVRYKNVLFAAWSGLLATFAYGFLESSLNSSFPIFALRNGYRPNDISTLLPAFVAGSLITQVPLGTLGDRIGRKWLLPAVSILGAAAFTASGIVSSSFYGLLITFIVAGMLVGSLYSMAMTYVSDDLPNSLIPLGNILMGICYSLGSMSGPIAESGWMKLLPKDGFFYGISVILLVVFTSCVLHNNKKKNPG
ncbi:MFS transporter [Terrilactibacillus sp. S3-3]|nr:MFS transporter [Terrilactibacillus sp. S3-3]